MPDTSIWGPLFGALILYSFVGPGFAGLSLLFTKRFRTRYFWIFSGVFAVAVALWLGSLVSPSHVFRELFTGVPLEKVRDLDYEIDRHATQGALFFRFHTDAETIQDLARARPMEERTGADLSGLVPRGIEAPSWWPPPWLERARAWHETGVGHEYRALDAWLLYDPANGDARFVMVGRQRVETTPLR